MVRWQPGDVVVWRETWRGQTYFAWPVRVVADDPDGPVPALPDRWEA